MRDERPPRQTPAPQAATSAGSRPLAGERPARPQPRACRTRVSQPQSRATSARTLQAIAACESGGNPSTDTGNGFYGKYQFTQETWQAVGGTGNPAAASEAEQDRRAAQLYAQAGPLAWPVCGQLAPRYAARPMTLAALRSEFPILERVAYLNAGHRRAGARAAARRRPRARSPPSSRRAARTRTSSAGSSCMTSCAPATPSCSAARSTTSR